MVQLVILRHGESEWNKSNKFCGWVDAPLSANGKDQALKSADLILQCPEINAIDVAFTSRLTRANQTEMLILDRLQRLYVSCYKTWRLNERHYGALQGRDKTEVLKEYGEEKYMFWRRAFTGCPPLCKPEDACSMLDHRYKVDLEDERATGLTGELPMGESLQMVIERLLPYYQSWIEPQLKMGRTVLIVTHGSVVRALLKILYSIGDEDIQHVNIPNGIPIKIELDDTTLKPLTDKWVYLDPERAKVEAEKVKMQGFTQ